jgi:ATP-dependent Clp protease adaptor protein ClpS
MLLSTTLKGPTMSQAGTVTKTQINQGLSEPPMFKIIYLNDNTTPMEFVIETLLDSFNYNEQTAMEITQDIHNSGSAVVAVLPYEIAEQKGIEVTLSARSQSYPLQVKLEPETVN